MELGTTDIERARKIWLLGHSYPEAWVHVLNEPLDPRHPTRHNIWTPVLDRLQERVSQMLLQNRQKRVLLTGIGRDNPSQNALDNCGQTSLTSGHLF
jgi:hypothetical protein